MHCRKVQPGKCRRPLCSNSIHPHSQAQMHVSILARTYARAQLQPQEVLDVVILSKARNDSVAVGRLLRWCGLQATNVSNTPPVLVFYQSKYRIVTAGAPSVNATCSTEYSGTSTQVDVSRVSGSEATMIESACSAPPVMHHSLSCSP